MKPSWLRLLMGVALGLGLFGITPKAEAMPQYSRRYNLKCSGCHTIAPALNEMGWMFKRLGHHLPPALSKGVPPETIAYLVKKEPQWTVQDNVSFAVADLAYEAQRNTQEGTTPSSPSAFQLNTWNEYAAGWVPDTNFFYFSELDLFIGGSFNPTLSNAFFGYVGGNAKSSWYLAGGREHLQIAEGTKAAEVYSLMPASPLLFETLSPTNFVDDQSPVGIDAGYTWASDGYKNILAATVKVTNGDNADGSEILGLSDKNAKDVWFDGDWWYAPESGVTFLDYYGKKDQIQNSGAANQFTYLATIRRMGVFANYLIRNKVDVMGGYMRNKDDWQYVLGVPGSYFTANDGYGELDYYITQRLAVSGRYDFLEQQITNAVGRRSTHQLNGAVNYSFVPSGTIVGRLAWSYLSGRDPKMAVKSTNALYQADISFNF
ncbi:MAG: hypothetical protein ACLQOO_01995 [Terriglobia bacterium]